MCVFIVRAHMLHCVLHFFGRLTFIAFLVALKTNVFKVEIYLFGVLRRFQHCTGHITTGSWKGHNI